jgi:integrase
MSQSSVRQIHAIISGALEMAVRWEWISGNPADTAQKPKQKPPQPKPPTAVEAAQIAARAWEEDFAWGLLIWLIMVTAAAEARFSRSAGRTWI